MLPALLCGVVDMVSRGSVVTGARVACLRAWIRDLADAGEVTGWEQDIVQRKLVT